MKNSSSPEQTGAAEDVDELMPAKPWCDHAGSAISPLEETDIAAVHGVFDAQNFSLLLSRDKEIGRYDNSTCRKTGKGKSIPKRQRPTEVNTVLAFAGGDNRIEIPTAPTKNPKSETMTSTLDDAELLKDLRGLGKPLLFDGNDTDVSFFTVSEDDSILLLRMDDVVDTGPDEHHRAIGEIANQMNQHIEVPQIQYTDKVADKSVAVQRQVSPRTTETTAPEYIGAVAGKYQWDDRPGGDADKDVQGEAIAKYCWSEGKTAVSIFLELDGLDDVTEDASKAESGKTNVSLTIASVASKQRIFTLTGLAHEITGVKVVQKKGKQTVSLMRAKREEKTWHKLLDDASTKEAVAEDTASSNTDITSRVSQTTLSDFSKNMGEPSPKENEEEIDDQTRSMDSHEIQCEKEYGIDLRADTGTLFFPGKIVMEQHSLTHFPNQPWSKETKSSGFEESAGELTNDRDSAKMPGMWITNTISGRRSTLMELASATPLNESKFSGRPQSQQVLSTRLVPRESTRVQMTTRCKPTLSRKETLGAGRRRLGKSRKQHDQHELE